MKLKLIIETTEKGYNIDALVDFDETRPKEYLGVGYIYAALKAITMTRIERLIAQSTKANKQEEITKGLAFALTESLQNPEWPFTSTKRVDKV